MEDKIRLILLTPDTAHAHWGKFIAGLESVLDKSTGDTTLPLIYNLVMAGHMQMWIAYLGEDYVGLCTTRCTDVAQGERYIDIVHGYLKPGVPYQALLDGIGEIEKYGEKYGYNSIRFYTTRDKAFERKMAPMGYKRGYTEFRKVLKEG
jgi:hypothetical protein